LSLNPHPLLGNAKSAAPGRAWAGMESIASGGYLYERTLGRWKQEWAGAELGTEGALQFRE